MQRAAHTARRNDSRCIADGFSERPSPDDARRRSVDLPVYVGDGGDVSERDGRTHEVLGVRSDETGVRPGRDHRDLREVREGLAMLIDGTERLPLRRQLSHDGGRAQQASAGSGPTSS